VWEGAFLSRVRDFSVINDEAQSQSQTEPEPQPVPDPRPIVASGSVAAGELSEIWRMVFRPPSIDRISVFLARARATAAPMHPSTPRKFRPTNHGPREPAVPCLRGCLGAPKPQSLTIRYVTPQPPPHHKATAIHTALHAAAVDLLLSSAA
jgi:hypothetical protein